MGMLTFSTDPPRIFEVPRIDDEQIDELFYQEDEIGEMRHAAFMIECGLEEDPPDGPDVPPIPWKPSQLTPAKLPPKNHRRIVEEKEASPSSSPVRRLAATRSGALHGMRRSLEKSNGEENKQDTQSPLRRERRPVQAEPRRVLKAKSGSLHGLRDATRRQEEMEIAKEEEIVSPRKPRKVLKAKSGSLHGMREASRKIKAVKEESEEPPTSPLLRSKLVATKSGTLHGMRQAAAAAKASKSDEPPKSPMRGKRPTSSKGTRAAERKDETKADEPLASPRRRAMAKGTLTQRAVDKKSSYSSETSASESFSQTDDSDEASLETDEDVPKKSVKQASKTKKSTMSKLEKKKAEADLKLSSDQPPQSTTKSRNRVFKNGKLVSDDAPKQVKQESKLKDPRFGSALDKFRNGASARELLVEARSPNGSKAKNGSSISNVGVPSMFQNSYGGPLGSASSSSNGTRKPMKIKIPGNAKSIGAIDVPPAFRSGGVRK